MKYYFYEACFNNDEEDVMVIQSETKLNKGDIVLFNQWNEWYHGSILNPVDTLLGITRHKKAPKVLRFIDIKEYNKENEKDIKKAILLSAMDELEDEIKIKDQRNRLAGKDERYKELLSEFEKLEEPIQIPNMKDDKNAVGDESAE